MMPTSLSTEIGVALPTGWRQLRAKYLLREVVERSESSSIDDLLTVSQYSGVTPTNADSERAGDISTYKRCRAGDLVVNTMLAWNGSLGIAPRDGVVSPAYSVYRFFDGTEPAFFSRMLRTPEYRRQIAMRSSGVVESRLRLYPTELYNLPLLVPSLQQQKAIVRFLEEKERDIEHYLAAKRRMIREYNERATALASARFDGLIKVYSSVRLKDACDITSGYSFESSGFVSDADGVRLVRGANVGIGRLRWTDENTVRWPAADAPAVARWALQVGDLVIGLNRPWIDGGLRLAEVRPEDLPCFVLQRVARLRARPSVLGRFLSLMLRTPRLLWELEPDFTGVGTPYIDEHRMKRFRIPLPPLSEQREMVELHANQTRDIEDALRVLEREIAVMEEYRARLIADAVTGQIDVRRLG